MKPSSTPARVMLLLNELQKKGLPLADQRVQAIFATCPTETVVNWQDFSRRLEALLLQLNATDPDLPGAERDATAVRELDAA